MTWGGVLLQQLRKPWLVEFLRSTYLWQYATSRPASCPYADSRRCHRRERRTWLCVRGVYGERKSLMNHEMKCYFLLKNIDVVRSDHYHTCKHALELYTFHRVDMSCLCWIMGTLGISTRSTYPNGGGDTGDLMFDEYLRYCSVSPLSVASSLGAQCESLYGSTYLKLRYFTILN